MFGQCQTVLHALQFFKKPAPQGRIDLLPGNRPALKNGIGVFQRSLGGTVPGVVLEGAEGPLPRLGPGRLPCLTLRQNRLPNSQGFAGPDPQGRFAKGARCPLPRLIQTLPRPKSLSLRGQLLPVRDRLHQGLAQLFPFPSFFLHLALQRRLGKGGRKKREDRDREK